MSIFVVIDNIWLATRQNLQKVTPPRKIAKSALTVTLFEKPPQAQIRPKSKYLCANQIANNQTIILSLENVIPGPSYGRLKKSSLKIWY